MDEQKRAYMLQKASCSGMLHICIHKVFRVSWPPNYYSLSTQDETNHCVVVPSIRNVEYPEGYLALLIILGILCINSKLLFFINTSVLLFVLREKHKLTRKASS